VMLASIEAEEQLLCVTLQKHAAGSSGTTTAAVFDPATQCRCQEALDFRDEATVIMETAKLQLAYRRQASNLPSLLTSMVLERPVIPIITDCEFK